MKLYKLVDTYVSTELLRCTYIFVLSLLGVFFGTSEVSSIIKKICEIGLPAKTALYLVAMHLPGAIIDCLPAAVLVATLFILHRMCADSEMIALLTSGFSFARIVSIFLVTGLLMSLVSFFVSELLVPQSKRMTWALLAAASMASEMPVSKSSFCDVHSEFDPTQGLKSMYMFVGKRQKSHLSNVTVIQTLNDRVNSLVHADKGRWKSGQWVLSDGQMMNFSDDRYPAVTSFGEIRIQSQQHQAKMYEEGVSDPVDFDTCDLIRYIGSHGGINASPALLFQLHKRFSKPLACFFILLAGVPMALSVRRATTWRGMAYAGIILTIYYSLASCAGGLAENGRAVPIVAAWLPNIVVGLVGLVILSIRSRQLSL